MNSEEFASQLQIGNTITKKSSPKTRCVVNEHIIVEIRKSNGWTDYAPLKIDNDVLLPLGYQYANTKDDGDMYFDCLTFEVDWIDKKIQMKSRYLSYDHYVELKNITHIHQLQNFIKHFKLNDD